MITDPKYVCDCGHVSWAHWGNGRCAHCNCVSNTAASVSTTETAMPMIEGKLADLLDSIIDGYYANSAIHKQLKDILDEMEFLYTRGMLTERGFGRANDIVKVAMTP